jgi:hypothetical protein
LTSWAATICLAQLPCWQQPYFRLSDNLIVRLLKKKIPPLQISTLKKTLKFQLGKSHYFDRPLVFLSWLIKLKKLSWKFTRCCF